MGYDKKRQGKRRRLEATSKIGKLDKLHRKDGKKRPTQKLIPGPSLLWHMSKSKV